MTEGRLNRIIREHFQAVGINMDAMNLDQAREFYPETYQDAIDLYGDVYDNDDADMGDLFAR